MEHLKIPMAGQTGVDKPGAIPAKVENDRGDLHRDEHRQRESTLSSSSNYKSDDCYNDNMRIEEPRRHLDRAYDL